MKAIVLSAGRGSRLGAATSDRPKALIRIEGRTLLERQLAALRFAGAQEVGVVTGWQAHAFSGVGVPTFHNPAWATTSMVDSLACASEWLRSDECLICYGDIAVSRSDAHRLAAQSENLAIAYDPWWQAMWQRRFTDPLSDAETFCCDESGRLTAIGQHAETIEDITGQYVGLLRTTPQGWDAMEYVRSHAPHGRPRDMTDLLSLIIESGRMPIWTVPLQEPWWEFDTPTDLTLGATEVAELDRHERRDR